MGAKRVLFPPIQTPIAKRLKRVEAMAKANRPEMQFKTFGYSGSLNGTTTLYAGVDICDISQGDGINQRQGNKIKVWRVEVRGWTSTSNDLYILQNHGTAAVSATSFGPYAGAFIDDDKTSKTTEWRHIKPNGAVGNVAFKASQKFRGMTIRYDGSGPNPVDNGLYLAILNRSGAAASTIASVKVWYTDA